ncbi:hypothetical protein, partial [Lysinibacillus xylanilyticus]|uniref:hypothetical protein n=1 Tax=Lysinibacillus xylanilyticus TaxID=582475 RepID=UPI0036DEA80A
MNIEGYVKKEYLGIYHTYVEVHGKQDVWEVLSNLAYLGCLVEGWEQMLDSYLKSTYKVSFRVEDPKEAAMLNMTQQFSIDQEDGYKHVILPAADRTGKELSMIQFERVSQIFYILPYLRSGFKPN